MSEQHVWGSAPEFVGPRHELRERLLLDVFLGGSPGERVLNVGAGAGSFTNLLVAKGFQTTSTDVSPAAVEVLRRRVSGAVVEADASALPFPADSFDAAVLGEVLEHLDDDRAALREVGRVLRRGGIAVASVPANPAWFGPSDDWAGHRRRYTRVAITEAFAAAGFTVELCRAWGFPVSSFYHRRLYEPRLARRGAVAAGRAAGPALTLLRAALQIDRLFVGVERGALGYLVRARL
jgi:ubiquinone/menaquinone biosynthesis C-methylase UbiE